MFIYSLFFSILCHFLLHPNGPRDALLFHDTDPAVGAVFREGLEFLLAEERPPFPFELVLSRNDAEILAELRGETGRRVRFVVAELPPPQVGHSLQRILHQSLEARLLLPEHLVLMALDRPIAERFNQHHQRAMGVVPRPCGIRTVWAVLRPRLEAFYASK